MVSRPPPPARRLLRALAAPMGFSLAGALLAGPLLTACEPNAPRPKAVTTPAAPFSAAPGAAPAARTLAARLGCVVRSTPHGALIVAIDMDGPAARAGARAGDVVTAVNGTTVLDAASFEALIAVLEPAAGLELNVLRQGSAYRVAVRPAAPAQPQARETWSPLGLLVRELPDTARSALGVEHGVMVVRVRPPASHTRILPGDVIVGVNQASFSGIDEFHRLVQAQRGLVALLVRRSDADLYITLSPPEETPAGPSASEEGEASQGRGAPPSGAPWLQRPATSRPLRT